MTLTIRSARRGEAGLVLQFVRDLAEYEKLSHEVVATEAILNDVLFADQPRVFCEFAEWNSEVAGFAVWLLDYSTFTGRHGIYLEDLFVQPAYRGKGIGKALMIHLARECVARDATNLRWSVLNWNKPSIDFYQSLGAAPLDEWTIYRLSGGALARLAERT